MSGGDFGETDTSEAADGETTEDEGTGGLEPTEGDSQPDEGEIS